MDVCVNSGFGQGFDSPQVHYMGVVMTCIYTGYFAKAKKYEEMGVTPVSIAQKPPESWSGLSIQELAPRWELVKKYKYGGISWEDYKKEYFKMLSYFPVEDLIAEVTDRVGDIVLLCYEKPDALCHRHLLAEYLNSMGYTVRELIV